MKTEKTKPTNIAFLKDSNFQEFIEQDKLTLLFFLSGMHLSCRRQIPLIRRFADDHPEYSVAVLDVGESPVAATACRIENVPHLVITRKGIVLGGRRGGIDRRDVADFLLRLDAFQKMDIEKHLQELKNAERSV